MLPHMLPQRTNGEKPGLDASISNITALPTPPSPHMLPQRTNGENQKPGPDASISSTSSTTSFRTQTTQRCMLKVGSMWPGIR